MTRWSSQSEAMAALDDVDWDMFWASSSDVSEFTDVALSFVNTLSEQATERITKKGHFLIKNRGWTEQFVMRLTIALPHTMPVFCQEK